MWSANIKLCYLKHLILTVIMWSSTFHRSNQILFSTHDRIHLWICELSGFPRKNLFFKNWSGNFIAKIFYTHDIYSQDIFVLIWEPQHQNHLHVHAFVLIWIRNDFPPWHILPRYAASHIIKISNAKYQMQNIKCKISICEPNHQNIKRLLWFHF